MTTQQPRPDGEDRSAAAGEGKESEAAGSAGAAREAIEKGPDNDRDRYQAFDKDDVRRTRRDQADPDE
ncbi:hypothetical protein IP88_10015 [alpha proteobacterium AAP81b]|nr:hypothetical protein IP88_10015 [alpha proteobacterium AAP81b]